MSTALAAPASAEQTQEIAKQEPSKAVQIRAQVEKQMAQSQDKFLGALGSQQAVDRWKTMLAMELFRKPDLLNCTPASIVAAAIEAASFGLEFGPRKHSYIIPRKGQATFSPSYMGLVHLAKQSGLVEQVSGQVVCDGDDFRYSLGLDPNLEHIPGSTRGAVTHAYAIVRFANGSKDFEVMDRSEIDAIRKRSASPGSGPWVTDYNEMAKKTVIRRICKRLDFGDRFADALANDSYDADEPVSEKMQMPVEVSK